MVCVFECSGSQLGGIALIEKVPHSEPLMQVAADTAYVLRSEGSQLQAIRQP